MNEPKGMRRNLANYGDAGFSVFLRKAFIKALGYSDDALERPIIGIVDTGSGYNACHANMPDLVEAAKRGVMLSGGIPIPFPVISIQESFSNPTSMYLRNLMAMDTEEMIRAQPMDAIVVIGGCDKTLPAQIMAAVSADLPTVVIPVGPMVVGHHKGEVLGACTDCRRMWGKYRAGEIDVEARQRPVTPDIVERREILLGHEADAAPTRQIAAFEAAFGVDEAGNHERIAGLGFRIGGLGRAGTRRQQRQHRSQRKRQRAESQARLSASGVPLSRFSAQHPAFALPDPLGQEV